MPVTAGARSRDRTEIALGGAVILTGLLAGLYYAFACSVMPGLARAQDRTFVAVMRDINQAILNPGFFLSFAGAPAATAAAAFGLRRRGARRRARWAFAALGCHALGLVITSGVNVPLNDGLERDGDRAAFEFAWNVANGARTLATVAALGCLVRCLTVSERAR